MSYASPIIGPVVAELTPINSHSTHQSELICTTGIFKDSEFTPILFKNIGKVFFKQDEARPLKLLPWSRMLFKMTIFWTKVIITHVTVNWIVLRFPTASTAGRRHIHCVYVLSYVFAWLKVLKTHYGATNSNIILVSLSYHFFQHLWDIPISITSISFDPVV